MEYDSRHGPEKYLSTYSIMVFEKDYLKVGSKQIAVGRVVRPILATACCRLRTAYLS